MSGAGVASRQTPAEARADSEARRSILPLRLEGIGLDAGGRPLLDGIGLRVERGARLVVLGPNGAGKSLLLRICHGLLPPDRGRVIWADGSDRPARQAMVFQRPVMLRRSARGNLDHALALTGVPRAARAAQIAGALSRFGLAALAERGARLLSGGEQQRLALARAWLTRPEILFLDEPTSALDPGAARQIEAIIADFSAEGMTIVMTTQNLGLARRLARDIAFLDRGRLREAGPAGTFFAGPATPEARAFLAGDLAW